MDDSSKIQPSFEIKETCHVAIISDLIFPYNHFCSFTNLCESLVGCIVLCITVKCTESILFKILVEEFEQAENYGLRVTQLSSFNTEIVNLQKSKCLPRSNVLLSLSPFLDDKYIRRVGGCEQNLQLNYDKQHPVILHGTHPLSRLNFACCMLDQH